jgi:hypothetical protein
MCIEILGRVNRHHKIMHMNFAALIPVTKFETKKASALVQIGFPAIEPVVPQILEWLQDRNWPVSRVFEPFLVRVGAPLAPYIRPILAGHDDVWKYSLLHVVSQSTELAYALRPELERIAATPSEGESSEEVDDMALEILEAIKFAQ